MEEQKFYNREGKEVVRQKCEIYTRVMGYLRPCSHYNTGKKSEFYSRKCFTEQASMNSKFARDFTLDKKTDDRTD